MTAMSDDLVRLSGVSRHPRSRRGFRKRPLPTLLLLLPASILIGLLLICTFAVMRISLGERYAEWSTWSIEAYRSLSDRYFLTIVADTLWLALVSAVATVLVSFPIALFMARTESQAARRVVLICIMLPMVVSLLVQSFGWIAILGPDGLVNRAVMFLTGSERAVTLLFNRAGVLLGLIQTTIPLAVLPIASSLRGIPIEMEEAAGVLGANRLMTYRHIIFPMAWPGIAAGLVLVFGFNTGAFVVPLLLGGLRVTTIAIAIRDAMGALLNWPLGAALSIVLIILALAVQAAHRVLGRRIGARE
jgi:putative spermidine/putrescine transport system permease protein